LSLNNGNNNHGHDDYHLDGFQSERRLEIVPNAHLFVTYIWGVDLSHIHTLKKNLDLLNISLAFLDEISLRLIRLQFKKKIIRRQIIIKNGLHE